MRTISAFLLASILLASCGALPDATAPAPVSTSTAVAASTFTLTSSAFAEGGEIPVKYTYFLGSQCSGENVSPPLSWTGIPAGTLSFALTLVDPDAGDWVHWVQFDLPPGATELPEAVGGPEVGVKGRNSFAENGYSGPCPPGGSHRYVFTLYALDTLLSLVPGASHADLIAAMQGHILATAQLTGMRGR